MAKRKRLRIYRFYKENLDKTFLKVTNNEGHTLRVFEYDENIKVLKDFNTQKKANEKVIEDYYRKKSGMVYGKDYFSTTNKQYEERVSKIKKEKRSEKQTRRVKRFKKGTSIIFTNKNKISRFDFMYVSVKVKVFFNGFYVISTGRGNYYYKRDYPDGVPDNMIIPEIKIATMRAVAPYGSNVEYTLLNWEFAHHQPIELPKGVIVYQP